MSRRQLILRGLAYYWRTHLAVVLGVATAVAVLAGALLVGDSVRGSLRDLVLERLGRTDQVVASPNLFRDALAAAIQGDPAFGDSFSGIAPVLVARGLVTGQESGRRAGQVAVYGVDERFWAFHGVRVDGPRDRDALISPGLAEQLGAGDRDAILVRVQRPTDVPIESLHGRKDDLGRTLRLTVAGVLPPESLGEFALEPQQGRVLAVFVPLARLQQELEAADHVNTLLVSMQASAAAADGLPAIVARHTTLDDFGLSVKASEDRQTLILSSSAGLLDDRQSAAAQQALAGSGAKGEAVFTYLANSMRIGDRELPYSLVAAAPPTPPRGFGAASPLPGGPDAASPSPGDAGARDPIVLNQWAADDLRARAGDTLTMEYYVWEDPGRLVSRSAAFTVAGIVPVSPRDRDLAPTYPGISDSPTLEEWDPPFPLDLRRIRPVDEQYWTQYRTTPKAYVPLDVGQRLWRSRYGAMTSFRVTPPAGQPLERAQQDFEDRLLAAIDPAAMGPVVRDVRASSLDASRGATDFGEYFVYFSFFLVVAAILLAALFFKLGVEQRVREVGLLRAVGFGPADVRRIFLVEGVLLSIAGSLIGVLGALGYASLLMLGLRTWWVDAVGTTALTLHVVPASLAAGVLGGVIAAVVCIWWTLRSLNRISDRSLLAGDIAPDGSAATSNASGFSRTSIAALALTLLGVGLLTLGATGYADPAGAFFGAGFALLAAALVAFLQLLRRRPRYTIERHGWQPLSRLGVRNAAYRPGRSVLSMAVIACATFILISVDAFRRDGHAVEAGRSSGLGGYALIVDTLLPVVHDPNTREGREALNLFDIDGAVTFEPFRLRPGDDASCLNLYEPRNPRILGARDAFLQEGRFVFASSLAATDAERANPWLLLRRQEPGVVPVIADLNSMTYVLHRALGDDIVIDSGGREIRLRLVAALRDSIFQGELLMSEANFRGLFPELEGYQFLLVDADPVRAGALGGAIENALGDFGGDVTTTSDRLAEFHRVENTYLSTFQTLGGLGLLLGTVGLAAVLLRNVLERRRELALLGAVGYQKRHFVLMILSENLLLLAGGLVIGAACAGLAIAPALAERGSRVPVTGSGVVLLVAVFLAGLLSSVVAVRAATRAPLLSSLRSE